MPTKGKATIIPTMRFHDAPRAIDWLCEAFGFAQHLVVPGEVEGTIAHAQLTLGDSMIMLGSHRDGAQSKGLSLVVSVPAGRLDPWGIQTCQVGCPRTGDA